MKNLFDYLLLTLLFGLANHCISQPSKSLKGQKLANVKILVNNLSGSGQIAFKASKEMLECTDKVNCTVYDYELPWTSLKKGENTTPLFPNDKYYALLQFDYKEYVPSLLSQEN